MTRRPPTRLISHPLTMVAALVALYATGFLYVVTRAEQRAPSREPRRISVIAEDEEVRRAHERVNAMAHPAADTTGETSLPPAPSGFSFRNHVIPVLTKTGCNSGPCHGAAAGKNGFSLTLRGYDPSADYDVLVRQAAGRRVNLLEPARSLMLLKPTEVLPHMGGKRFEPRSPEYSVIAKWIAAGAPPPADTDPRLARLEISPATQQLAPGKRTRLEVVAHFSDGHTEDVTRWAKYGSTDESVLEVDEYGVVTVRGHGEAAVDVGYLTEVGLARVTVPFDNNVPADIYRQAPRASFIDDLVLHKLETLRIAPSRPSTDEVFIRRAFLDAAGILPTPEEVTRFVKDPGSDKRARLVDAILARPEYVDYWAYKWSDLLKVSTRKLSLNNTRAFYSWIRQAVAANQPWDAFVRELTTATGRSVEHGAVNYYVIHPDPLELMENYTQAFLGLTLTCARCHNHPMQKWTQNDYYGYANLFARVSVKDDIGSGKNDARTVYSTPTGDVLHPRTGAVLPPRPLDAKPLSDDAKIERREYLAEWVTSPENALFARAIVNRVWANFLGRGLVHPVDDLRATNPTSNEELMTALTKQFVESDYDMKALITLIMNSATYQQSSITNETNANDDRYYSHYIVRRLPAEVILDAISQVTGRPEKFPGFPAGTRALQLPDTNVDSYFLTTFGRPERLQTSAAERQQDATLTQAVHAINGDTINEKLQAPDGIVATVTRNQATDEQIVDHLFLAAFARRPAAEERTRIVAALGEARASPGDGADVRREVTEDLLWAMLTSKEFLFNH